jgi:hypothetical protein
MRWVTVLTDAGSSPRARLSETPVLNDRGNRDCLSLPCRALFDKCVRYAEQRANLKDMPLALAVLNHRSGRAQRKYAADVER